MITMKYVIANRCSDLIYLYIQPTQTVFRRLNNDTYFFTWRYERS
jgi:hypothetical protein